MTRPNRWFLLVAPLPALVLGVVVMRQNGVPSGVWGQNVIAGVLLMIFCLGRLMLPRPSSRGFAWGVALTAILSVGLLLATFANAGLNGVHRWVLVGPVRLHAGAVCLPALIIVLGKASVSGRKSAEWIPWLLGTGVMVVLLLQPDAAQASAFAGALITILLLCRPTLWWNWVVSLAAVICAIGSWMRPDPLVPVRHVEGIVGLAAQSGVLWLWAALATLALLPCPFLLSRGKDGHASPVTLALGVYFALTLIAPCFGSFPVPLLGFGLSPIVGYFVALAWLLGQLPNRTNVNPVA